MKKPELDHLLRKWQKDGDVEARNKVVEEYQNVVQWWVSKRRPAKSGQLGYDDLFQLANLGLLKACDAYDPDRENANFFALLQFYFTNAVKLAPCGRLWWERSGRTAEKWAGSMSDDTVATYAEVPSDTSEQYGWSALEQTTAESIVASLAHDVRRVAQEILEPQEYYVYREHYERDRNFSEIARGIGLTRQGAQQIGARAKRKLREYFGEL